MNLLQLHHPTLLATCWGAHGKCTCTCTQYVVVVSGGVNRIDPVTELLDGLGGGGDVAVAGGVEVTVAPRDGGRGRGTVLALDDGEARVLAAAVVTAAGWLALPLPVVATLPTVAPAATVVVFAVAAVAVPVVPVTGSLR